MPLSKVKLRTNSHLLALRRITSADIAYIDDLRNGKEGLVAADQRRNESW